MKVAVHAVVAPQIPLCVIVSGGRGSNGCRASPDGHNGLRLENFVPQLPFSARPERVPSSGCRIFRTPK